ncbi:NADH:ubiquinone oxidoreductase subunit NDUFA12 [Brevirhabdus pacifica]|uniref:NADH:ubiquinone oxidoreductase subunit NDUFA12 n=1 Tax=Brevirhabdus pacifica TaxID=1267768 RepID=A0A1U7DFT1_9RHOB|nr:NADH:ubiquinone oxidoreductase subunit NDUFA12 [Brevirhabdus pacifica]APX88860.1 NADH:ubiquinone oxidoreductase subunit NDUFA12 [Brevirhabdus pacifica]OWU80097.1 NADH dehydrogenase [Loktanella sp. 22II-4b]PJJ86599.1 NADH:ubiquinone oxidoreductase subunit [Brevirhabdus pacifica]
MGIKTVLLRAVTWWNGQTLGTQLFTKRNGLKVGEDAQGNIFYQTEGGKRRWVIFNGEAEASRVSPEWHGWLHHTWNEPPTEVPLVHKPWEKEHVENLTGTDMAYAPPGSIRRAAPAPRMDYEAWQPE